MEKIIEIISAMDEEEKRIIVKEIDSDILHEELWRRDIENRNAIAEIKEALKKRENKWD